jgi:O-antigen/teichoic acid export membrane protein
LLGPVFLAAATELNALGEHQRFRELFALMAKIGYALNFAFVVALVTFPDPILDLLYGRGFPVNRTILFVLVGGFSLNVMFGLNASALMAEGDRRVLLRTGVLTCIGALVAFVVAVPLFHEAGAAWALFGAMLLRNILTAREVYASTGLHPFRTDVLVPILLSVPVVVIGGRIAGSPFGIHASLVQVVLVAGGLWLAWLVAVRMTGSVTERDVIALLRPQRAHV